MDIAALSTGLSQAQLATDVSTSVAKKSLDAEKQQGAALVSMIAQAGSVGGPEAGKGGSVDVVG